MPQRKLKSLDDYNSELRARLHKLRDRHQQIEIARRTGVPAPNVHRYLRAGKIPAEFCLALVDAFDLSPEWLVKGEGAPVTSDVNAATAAKAGELLDLVKAMNAVARMRLGAVVGDRDRKQLRELADTLETFDRLRERMNDKTRPVLKELLDDLGEALGAMDTARASVLRETAVELSRLCTDEQLLERLDSLQSGVEYLTGNPEQALQYDRRVFGRRVRDGRIGDAQSIISCLHLVMTLRDTGRIEEARRVCGAILSLVGEVSDPPPQLFDLRLFMGNFHIELGDLDEGMAILQRTYPLLPAGYRFAGTILLMRGMLLAGLIGFEEALHFGDRSNGSARLLVRYACFREDEAMLKHVTGVLLGHDAVSIPPEEYDAQRAQLLQRAQAGKGKLADFDKMVAAHPPVVATQPMRRLLLALHRGQYARLLGDRKALRVQVEESRRALEALPPEVFPRCEFKVLQLRNLTALGRSKTAAARADALRAELENWVNRGYRGLLPLA